MANFIAEADSIERMKSNSSDIKNDNYYKKSFDIFARGLDYKE